MTGGCVDPTLWKFVAHIVYIIKLTKNFLTKFCHSNQSLNGNVSTPLSIKIETPISA